MTVEGHGRGRQGTIRRGGHLDCAFRSSRLHVVFRDGRTTAQSYTRKGPAVSLTPSKASPRPGATDSPSNSSERAGLFETRFGCDKLNVPPQCRAASRMSAAGGGTAK